MAENRENETYAGPSGTAVAGLIVALIALAVGLYAAFSPVRALNDQQMTSVVERVTKAIVAQSPGDAPPEAVIRAMVRDEVSRAYLVPEPGPDPGMDPGSNVITLPGRKQLHFQRTQ